MTLSGLYFFLSNLRKGINSGTANGKCVSEIIASGIIPSGMEMMDKALIHATDNFVKAGYPRDAESMLIVELDGLESEVEEMLDKVNNIAKKLSLAENLDEKTKYKTRLLASANVLGILQHSPKKWLGIGQIQDNLDSKHIEDLINQRNEARKNKDFKTADEIRNKLTDLGIEIEDTPNGTIWRSI